MDAATEQQMKAGSLTRAQIAQLSNNYKLTPATLMAECVDWWTPSPWLQYLGAEIASAVARGGCGLLVSAPPRHGKSKLITVATPLWVLENFPKKNVIVTTYGEDLSTDFTREVKDIIKNNQDKLSIRVRRDVDRAANFLTPQGGGLKAVGLRGTITGRGADILIIDDYIKEPKEALSHEYLESLKTWYQTVARTRLEPGAVVIVVATRWVTNDLHGHIERLEKRRKRPYYKIIKVKAIAGKQDLKADPTGETWVEDPSFPDVIGRKPGEPLFPERYTRDTLLDIIDELGARWFEAMFQQNPQGDGSATTDPNRLRIISKDEYDHIIASSSRADRRFKHRRSWDFASTKDAGDYTCGIRATYDTMTENMYYTGMVHGQFAPGKVQEQFIAKNETDPEIVEYVIEQESGASGVFAAKVFLDLAKNRKIRVIKAASSGSKLLKAQMFLTAADNRKIFLVVENPLDYSKETWVQKFIDEFTAFGESAHDDIMDAAVGAYNDASGKKFKAGTFGRSAAALAAQQKLKDGDGTLESIGAPLRPRHRATFGRTVLSGSAKSTSSRSPAFRSFR